MNAHQETMKQTYTSPVTRADVVTWAGFTLALLAGATAILAGFGSRAHWWDFMTGFAILRDAAIGGLIAAVVSLVGGVLVRHEHHPSVFALAAIGIVIGLVTAGVPMAWLHTAESMPKIHDISTDVANPPVFISIMPLRQNAENGAEYVGSAVAVQQQAAYPDIKPIVLPVAASTAFKDALETAKNMGWDIVSADAAAGRIEAVATTFWFGFKDDVVVRITPVAGGTRVDLRSVSRVGLNDIGTNASRVRTFLRKLGDLASIDPSYSIGY